MSSSLLPATHRHDLFSTTPLSPGTSVPAYFNQASATTAITQPIINVSHASQDMTWFTSPTASSALPTTDITANDVDLTCRQTTEQPHRRYSHQHSHSASKAANSASSASVTDTDDDVDGVRLTFSSRASGSSVLFQDATLETSAYLLRELDHLPRRPEPIQSASLSGIESAAAHMSADQLVLGSAAVMPQASLASLTANMSPSIADITAAATQRRISSRLPRYTRILYYMLMSIGVVRIPTRGSYATIRSYIWPLMIALYFFINIFFVNLNLTASSSVTSQSIVKSPHQLIANYMINTAPLTAWLAGFYWLGYKRHLSLVLFKRFANLERYNIHSVRIHMLASIFAGIILFSIIVGNIPTVGPSVISGINLIIYLILNYITMIGVVVALFSLTCRFHHQSLLLYQSTLILPNMTVSEAIREHVVLMRLTRESINYLQYIIVPPFILFLSGSLLSSYLMIIANNYPLLSTVAFQLVAILLLLIIPMHTGAAITATCNSIKYNIMELNLLNKNTIIDRQAIIQELCLLPSNLNGFAVFGWLVTHGRLAFISYLIVSLLLLLVQQAFHQGL